MIDFIEYVVTELKSKRLSRASAVALVRQFSGRTATSARASVIHPLLHRNTSDLNEQRYSSAFTGEEFFLADHRLSAGGQAGLRVLPGVAHLEMARAAIEDAVPRGAGPAVLELRDTVWARPVVVTEGKELCIALSVCEAGRIGFEVYGTEGDEDVVHCQGSGEWLPQTSLAGLDTEQLKSEMTRGRLSASEIYATCERMGLIYGPSFQAITAVHRGAGQLLAELRLPESAARSARDYVLHPSLVDAALQAAVGLVGDDSGLSRPRLPFALERVRVLLPWTAAMVAWVRYAPGSHEGDRVVRLDVDLCDERGNVCVQLRGFSARAMGGELASGPGEGRSVAGVPATAAAAAGPEAASPAPAGREPESLAERTELFLRRELAKVLKVAAQKVDPLAALENYGIDSIVAMKLTSQLETTFGSLPKTLFFEYRTVRELAVYFITNHAARMEGLLSAPRPDSRNEPVSSVAQPPPATRGPDIAPRGRHGRRRSPAGGTATPNEPIAVIGLSGRYPGAVDVEAYWESLCAGRDCITEVPQSRWNWREYFSEDRSRTGHHYSKWGGFIEGVDEFDPSFFNISPVEAEQMDPQERLFLQHAWTAIEDAGYTRASLQVHDERDLPGQVGVYAGVMYTEYQLFGVEAAGRGKRLGVPGSAATIANRVSYLLNLHGPSMTLDTMCSSSLTAIHLACEDLRRGRTSLAIAGGVNVSIHPNKYLVLSDGQFISSDGHCQSFGEGGDGYIPGEGVGVVVLKRLSEAERDRDHVYGLIRACALTHGGKTNGYSVPNPQAQTSAIARALAEARVDARHISYVEAHGTGTKLGDPIEIAALTRAFQKDSGDTGFCLLGSAKSNIGHCESAAGIAGLTKVLLQLQHGQIVPSLHSEKLNPSIDFSSTPFVVNQTLRDWERPMVDGRTLPRIAGVSSFGAGGSNAHMIVEEYRPGVEERAASGTAVIVLSARTPAQLRERAAALRALVRRKGTGIDLLSMAYTLQVGREAMEERLGMVVGSVEELSRKLDAYLAGDAGVEDVHEGRVKRNDEMLSVFNADVHLQQAIDQWIVAGKISKLLGLWVNGLEVAWSKLYGEAKPRRMSLPAYPFARERYWIDLPPVGGAIGGGAAVPALHPMLHTNTSDMTEQRYSTSFTGEEFFLADHQVTLGGSGPRKVLPGVAYLEMARAAIEAALPERPEGASVALRDNVWAQPVVFPDTREVHVALAARDDDQVDYEVYSLADGEEIVHCQGRAVLGREPAPSRLDVGQLDRRMIQGSASAESVYLASARSGVAYGPSFRGIAEVHRGTGELLARLRLPAEVERTLGSYVLHPSLMDAALQACVALLGEPDVRRPRVPFAVEELRIVAPCTAEMVAWIRYARHSQATDPVAKVDIDLCDAVGNVCAQLRGLSTREMTWQRQAPGALLAVPVWEKSASLEAAGAGDPEYAEHHVVLWAVPGVQAGDLESVVPGSRCVALGAERSGSIAERFGESALECFDRVQALLRQMPEGRVLFQVVVPSDDEQGLFEGLSGLLKTAALENPSFAGQLIATESVTAQELGRRLLTEMQRGRDAMVRYERGARKVRRWRELADQRDASPSAFKEGCVYLITGGLGGLGTAFTRDILERAAGARVVLTGRGPLTAERVAALEALRADHGRVAYRQMDLGDRDEVRRVVASIRDEYGRLDGLLHSAGMTSDAFLVKKGGAEFRAVLAPKVGGTIHLDDATRDVELDFFVVFSSIAGAMGNAGQSDYATANAFLDGFAAWRNALVAANRRHGRTRAINWPLWRDGGMGVDPATCELLARTTGMQPMETATGLEAFHRSLTCTCDQMLVVEGDRKRLRRVVLSVPEERAAPAPASPSVAAAGVPADRLGTSMQDYLRRQFSDVLKLPFQKIDPEAALEDYGIDSILAMKLTNQLEKTFGPLSKTLLFEHQTVAALSGHFLKAHPVAAQREIGSSSEAPRAADAGRPAPAPPQPVRASRSRRYRRVATGDRQEIAIVGLAGRYPQAANLLEFWRNLQEGRDCITEVPPERWDIGASFDPVPGRAGKSYSKWGGFIDDVDKFDPLFFNISPKEASLIDPQERLFLETAWETIEDAGYSRESLSGRRVGVYVGVMWGQYQLYGAESVLRGNASLPTSSHASVANRVSYFFDFHGPSIAVDSMCSSSLTAIHLACEALRSGEIEAAIAGGVNVSIHPYKYLTLSQGRFAATDGKCRSFGAGGDGYVPGEGVGAVLLKPVEHALRDGDQIYAVVKSSAVSHGGKTNGYSVPNPNAQGDLIAEALAKGGVDPRTLSYVETHGTGTSLGDPIEIAGLVQAFGGVTEERQFCPIGSVKSNIGHLESAAGIAAVTKSLLQIRYGQLVPSIHADPLNPHIDFANSPFYVQRELVEWKREGAQPRRIGVSSFGAGGSNAHLILEEYVGVHEARTAGAAGPEVVLLSAKTQEALCRYAERVARFVETFADLSLADLAHTSQVGRTAMDARLAIVASSVEELRVRLEESIVRLSGNAAPEGEGVFYGNRREVQKSAGSLVRGAAGRAFIEALLAGRELEQVAALWVLGADVDWSVMPRQARPRRTSLPTYPFAKERCWIPQELPAPRRLPASLPEPMPVVAPERPERGRRICYGVRWSKKELPAQDELPSESGSILILNGSEELCAELREQLRGGPAGGAVVLVKPGKAFADAAPNTYVLDPASDEQFHQLVAALDSRGQLPGVILHQASGSCHLEVRQEVATELSQGPYALARLWKALSSVARRPSLKIVSAFSGGPATPPLAAAMSGFCRTVALEDPTCFSKVVDLDGGRPLAEVAGLLLGELRDREWSAEEVRYRGEGRFVRELLIRKETRGPSTLPLRQQGVYLITGGLGGLGTIFAEYLARNYRAKVVLVGRSAPDATRETHLARLEGLGAEVLALQADVTRLEDMEEVVREAKRRFSEIHGVIHAAGVIRDAFIVRKTATQMDEVLAPKVFGTINIDLATKGESLDFLALFSSVAGVMGNVGQCDYSYGSRFLDFFAESREALRRAQMRSGRTLSISWPLWEEGGMRIAEAERTALERETGISPMPTDEGLRAWEEALGSDSVETIVLYGAEARITALAGRQRTREDRRVPAPRREPDAPALVARTEAYLKALIGEEIKLDAGRIASSDPLESLGIDSVMINGINAALERDLGALPKTLLYQHETVEALAAYLVLEAGEALQRLLDPLRPAGGATAPVDERATRIEETPGDGASAREREPVEGIAIIGVHGRYPHSPTPYAYWENLRDGRELIDVVPRNRWDYEEFYDPDPNAAAEGMIYCKWGGLLDGHDEFDPQFFKIPIAEARMMDPQERLFLQSVWTAIEDAGYTRSRLRERFPKNGSADVGVFVGVTTNSYHLWAPEERMRGSFVAPVAMPWSIANRVSYFFDFNGPSLPIDTACSSSLVAIHLACESLRNRECQVAIAGGVNLYLHPAKYQSLCLRRMVSLDGKCRSYGAGGEGFVPGEGVGTVVLKPLSQAIEDRDRIYGVIRSSACDHSGRSNGYSAPNPNAQANLIREALRKAAIDPETISYVEGHGTGTALGDGIEVAALTQAFRSGTSKRQFCPIGSVKANIGHSESAAGIAGLTKVLLQIEHGQLVPTLHSEEPNPNIDFQDSPFFLQHGLSPWPATPDHPRRALVNSFGAGGVNACVVVEEYEEDRAPTDREEGSGYLFLLSARDESRLREYAEDLLTHLTGEERPDLAGLCYTLQVAREAMDERVAIVASGLDDLVSRLGQWLRRGSAPGAYRGSLGPRRESRRALRLVKTGVGEQSLDELASKWVAGEPVEWEGLYSGAKLRRVAAPTYPFSRERFWVSDVPNSERTAASAARLHPLVSRNCSTLDEVRFSSSLPDTAFYAVDHQVREERMFPGAGFLEMAYVAASLASEERVRSIRDVVWIRPLSFRTGAQSLRTVLRRAGAEVEFAIVSFDEENEAVVHSEGRLAFGSRPAERTDGGERIALEALKVESSVAEDGAAWYGRCDALGLHYGPSFRTIQKIWTHDRFVLARLAMPDRLRGEFSDFLLHPSLIDGALQTVGGLMDRGDATVPLLPFALDEIEILKPCPQECYAYGERADGRGQQRGGVMKFHVSIVGGSGEVLIRLKNLCVRPLAEPVAGSDRGLGMRKPAGGRLLSLSGGPLE